MGIDYNDTINSIRTRKPTKYAATYYLLVEKLSTPRKSSLPMLLDNRRRSVDPTSLKKAAEKTRYVLPNSLTLRDNMRSPQSKRKIKKSPHLQLPVAGESHARSATNSPTNKTDDGLLKDPLTSYYNVKNRRPSVGETIQQFFKDKLTPEPAIKKSDNGTSGSSNGAVPSGSGSSGKGRKNSITDFLKSPLEMARTRANRRHSVATILTPASPESVRSVLSPLTKQKNKKIFPEQADVPCNG
eukprot:sb/3469027/